MHKNLNYQNSLWSIFLWNQSGVYGRFLEKWIERIRIISWIYGVWTGYFKKFELRRNLFKNTWDKSYQALMYVTLVGLILWTTKLSGQQYIMSKEQIVEKVISSNLALRIADQEYQIRWSDFQQMDALRLPNIQMSYNGISTNSPLMAFGSRLNQATIEQSDFNPSLLNSPGATQNFSYQLQVQQPIFNPDKTHLRQAAQLGMEATELKRQRTLSHLVFQVEGLYMKLQLSYKTMDVINQAIATALSNYENAKNALAVGYLQQVDILAIEMRISELKNELLNVENQVVQLSDQLHYLMEDNMREQIVPSDELTLSLESMPESLSRERVDFRAMYMANEAYEQQYKAATKGSIPRVNMFAHIEANDHLPLVPGAVNYLVGLQLHWNLFDGNQRKSNIQRQKAIVNKSKLETEQFILQNNVEFMNALRLNDLAIAKYKTVKLAISQAEENLRIRSNRLSQGLEKATDVLMAETKYSQQRLMEYQAIFEINYTQLLAEFLSR